MNQKTILGLAAILALTLISIAGFYFFSPKHAVEKPVQTSVDNNASAVQASEVAASEAASNEIPAAEVDGIDVKELTTGSKSQNTSKHEPELLSFEFDQNLKAAETLEYMMAYAELPDFEQKNIRQYQQYVVDKIAKDTGKSSQQIQVLSRGALESEQVGNRYYVYKFKVGKDCEIHMVSTDMDQGDYKVNYNYCSG
ncbi:hypothetical protein [Acinetobacter beijerinckii]|uniref:Uncharacterized protein n=1 Tax=Acinetobacter beijerinckii CIP 110307 TaxID=1217648 RepID=N9FP70_9GAMM|nr:hypothetical protein [Acinetobacter beijerinckii]ENW06746.1 hypothetical protein F933_01197 [Acinetobacter beijerinckii CIP 110307]